MALTALAKNENMDYAVATLTQHLNQLGHVRAKIMTDGEPAVKHIVEKLRKSRPGLLAEQARRYSFQSIGGVGWYRRQFAAGVRTLKSDLEMRFGLSIWMAMSVWPWLVRHVGWLRERYSPQSTGRTGSEVMYKNQYDSSIVPFRRYFVMFMEPALRTGHQAGGMRTHEGATTWRNGLRLGRPSPATPCLSGRRTACYVGVCM